MTARVVQLAEAMKDRIAGATLPAGTTVSRVYRIPTVDAGKTPDLKIYVIPQEWNPGEPITRGLRAAEYTIQIALAVDLDTADEVAEGDAVTVVMDTIVGLLEEDIGTASFDRAEIPALYDDDQIRSRLFLTAINATYREGVG